jgi:hypothetical protein
LQILEATQLLHLFNVADFEATQSLHHKFVSNKGSVLLHRFIMADFEAIQSLHRL